MKMIIRPYQSSDNEKLIQLWSDCGLVVSHNNPIRDINRKLRVNPEMFLVGELDGKLIASCMAGYEGHRGWINYLAVSPSFQRKGHANEIMKAAEKLLNDAGCPKINLQVRTTNHTVIEFYKSIGYIVDDVISLSKRFEVDEPYEIEQDTGPDGANAAG